MNKGQSGEDFVNQVAYGSFLNFWCYPNPLDITGDNKEICDLLILFDKTCVLISVKNYSFDGKSYSKYFKRTAAKAIRQLKGAERKLFGSRVILLKHPDRDPELFPRDDIERVIRIVVNLNTEVKYYQTSFIEGEKHYVIMDAEAWRDVINVMNTFPDFIKYLEDRSELFKGKPAYMLPRDEFDWNDYAAKHLWAEAKLEIEKGYIGLTTILGRERDLLALYIMHAFKFPEQMLNADAKGLTLKIDGEWEKFKNSALAKKLEEWEADSYFIDHIGHRILQQNAKSHKLARLFYRLDRFDRKKLSQQYLEYHKRLSASEKPINFERSHVIAPHYSLVFLWFVEEMPQDYLEVIINASLEHNAYLHDWTIREIGLIGVSKTFEVYAFGYLEPSELASEERITAEFFKNMGWRVEKLTDEEKAVMAQGTWAG